MRPRLAAIFLAFVLIPPAFGQQQTSPTPVKPADAGAPDVTPDANGKLSQEQMEKLLRVVSEKDMENDRRERDYTYIERDVQNKLDGKGATKSTEIRTSEILEI